jgi:glycosyltransferase involved in cell wall biosynthesis
VQLRDYQPDLIHCHGGRALKYAMLVRPFWRARAYVYTKIGSVHPWLDPPLKRRLYGFFFEQVDAIVAVGDQVRREVETTFAPRHPRLLTINTGREVAPFEQITPEGAARTRAELGLDPTNVCLMSVGSLSWEKDPMLLLRVFMEIVREHPQVRLVFVGEGPLRSELEQQTARAGIQNHVRFLGVRSDVPQLLSAADIFAVPSITEGLPGVLIEAGMAGLPAVAFDVGSVEDILKDGVTGFVVPERDSTLFARRLVEMICAPDLRRTMGNEALRLCRHDFDIQLSVRRHEVLFDELTKRSCVPQVREVMA